MVIANYYKHCGEQWAIEDCDKFHNARCPICNKAIKPKTSVKKTKEGFQTYNHKTGE